MSKSARFLSMIGVFAGGVAAGLLSTALATSGERPTLERCATLLPKGEQFSFELVGTVDTAGAAPRLSGEFSLSDGTQRDRSQDGAAFGQCFATLVR